MELAADTTKLLDFDRQKALISEFCGTNEFRSKESGYSCCLAHPAFKIRFRKTGTIAIFAILERKIKGLYGAELATFKRDFDLGFVEKNKFIPFLNGNIYVDDECDFVYDSHEVKSRTFEYPEYAKLTFEVPNDNQTFENPEKHVRLAENQPTFKAPLKSQDQNLKSQDPREEDDNLASSNFSLHHGMIVQLESTKETVMESNIVSAFKKNFIDFRRNGKIYYSDVVEVENKEYSVIMELHDSNIKCITFMPKKDEEIYNGLYYSREIDWQRIYSFDYKGVIFLAMKRNKYLAKEKGKIEHRTDIKLISNDNFDFGCSFIFDDIQVCSSSHYEEYCNLK